MKGKFHMALLAVFLVAVMAGSAVAATYTGEVDSVDVAGGKLTVERMELQKKTFEATSALLQGIAKGDKVTVTYEKEGANNVASKVEKKK